MDKVPQKLRRLCLSVSKPLWAPVVSSHSDLGCHGWNIVVRFPFFLLKVVLLVITKNPKVVVILLLLLLLSLLRDTEIVWTFMEPRELFRTIFKFSSLVIYMRGVKWDKKSFLFWYLRKIKGKWEWKQHN
jgi:hypothetical protein